MKDRHLCKTDPNQAKEFIQTGEEFRIHRNERIRCFLEETSGDNAGQDNRDLCDEGSANQTLQHDEIQQLKSEGASGQTIISQLVSKSATFEKKTVFSQQKYLNKKKKK